MFRILFRDWNHSGRKTFEEDISTFLFDFEDLRIKNSNGTMRLRKRGDVVEVTFKQKELKSGAKVAEETGVVASDFGKMRTILLSCGLKELSLPPKHRTSYSIKDAHFEFDTYQGIPMFLEIESTSVDRICERVEKLGYTMDQVKDWGPQTLLKNYGIEIGNLYYKLRNSVYSLKWSPDPDRDGIEGFPRVVRVGSPLTSQGTTLQEVIS